MWWKINCVTSRSMEKRRRFCTSLYILGTWVDIAGFKYEWKVKGECILTHYFKKNYFIFNQFSVTPDLWHESWHFLENHSYKIVFLSKKIIWNCRHSLQSCKLSVDICMNGFEQHCTRSFNSTGLQTVQVEVLRLQATSSNCWHKVQSVEVDTCCQPFARHDEI